MNTKVKRKKKSTSKNAQESQLYFCRNVARKEKKECLVSDDTVVTRKKSGTSGKEKKR